MKLTNDKKQAELQETELEQLSGGLFKYKGNAKKEESTVTIHETGTSGCW